jgi:hypothetical protein
LTPHISAASAPIILLLFVTFCYGVGCWIWPFRKCRRCHGTGRRTSPTRRGIRLCRWCRGSGLRLRAGRWIYNQLTHLRREGTR